VSVRPYLFLNNLLFYIGFKNTGIGTISACKFNAVPLFAVNIAELNAQHVTMVDLVFQQV